MIIKSIAIILGTIFEFYSTNLYISTFVKRKKLKNILLIFSCSTILIFQIIASLVTRGVALLVCSFITAFFLCLIYDSKYYVKLIISATIVVINIASEMMASGIIMLSKTTDFEKINTDSYLFSLGILMSKFMMFVIVLIIYISKVKLNSENIKVKQLAILSILPITTIFMIVIMYNVLFYITSVQLKILFVFSSVLMILSNIITFYVINKQNRLSKAEYELKLLSENIKEQTRHYKELQLSHEEIRQMRHNMRNMCIAIIAEIKAGNTHKAIEQLNSNITIIDDTNKIIDTGHPSIDTIIESKLNICNELNINMRISYQYERKININEIEIAVIIGNILDNAIEACKKIDKGDKEIWGIIKADNTHIIINVKNTAKEFNDFKTLKRNSKNHGHGLRSIKHIANKYNGYAKFSFDKNTFSSYVVLEN